MTDFTTATAILDIDLDAVSRNLDFLQSLTGPGCALAAIVKADAYGLGLQQIAALHARRGTKTFFVATLDEGIALRAVLGPGPEIGILGGLFHGAERDYEAHALTPVLNSLADIERWDRQVPAMLHIDTGMRRLGLDSRDIKTIRNDPDRVRGLKISVILSHFACADEPGHPLTARQFEEFSSLIPLFPQARKSLSNSAGMFLSPDYHFDLVRPGMAVYGLNPLPDRPNPMAPVVQLRARVLQTRMVLAGESIGYGATLSCAAETRVATIGLGYADGFLRSLGNQGCVFHNGIPCPVLGRVSMDLVTIDITRAAGLREGDWVEVLGPHQDADALARSAGTIGYEILTSLGGRYARRYHGLKTFEKKAVSG